MMEVVRALLYSCLVVVTPGCAFHVHPTSDVADMASLDVAPDLAGSSDVDLASPAGPGDLATSAGADLAPPLPADLATVPGMLSGTSAAIPGNVDLSGEGKVDWAHFGMNAVSDVNHKSGGPAAIAMAAVGASLQRWPSYTPTFNWSNGTPTSNGPTNAGVYVKGVGNAITLTVPADRTARTLRVYLSNFESVAALTAHLSDGSAPDFGASVNSGGGNSYTRYTLAFRAGSAGQTLQITWTLQTDNGGGYASVDVLAATLY